MTRLDEIFEDYIIINCLFFLIKHDYISELYKPKGITEEASSQNYYLKHILEHLVYLDIVTIEGGSFHASKKLKKLLDWREFNKLYIHLGYKQFFENIGSKSAKKNHAYLSEGSSGIIKDETKIFLKDFFKNYHVDTILDLGSGKSKMIIELAQEYPDKKFYGFEINGDACRIAEKEIIEKKIKNISIIQGDIKKLHNIPNLAKIDCIISSFVLHEFIEDSSLQSILQNISKYISPQYILLREFCPPKKIYSIKNIVTDSFYFGHNLLHVLSKQETYIIKEWDNKMLNYNYINILTHHRFPYSNNESLYPILCYEKSNA